MGVRKREREREREKEREMKEKRKMQRVRKGARDELSRIELVTRCERKEKK